MIKKTLLFLLLLSANFTAACQEFRNSKAKADPSKTTMNANQTGLNQNANSAAEDKQKNKEKYPRVWLGQIKAEKGKLILLENVVWTFDEEFVNEKNESLYLKSENASEFEADIMNCAGFLVTVKITRQDEREEWKLSLLPETVAADALEKMKRCASDSNNEDIINSAFAVAPRNGNRKNIKIGKVNTQKLFASLPKDVKDFLNSKYAVSNGRKKNELSLLQNDLWTDLDGDGKIDLLYYSAAYDEEHSSGGILFLDGNKWVDIGTIRD